VPCLYGDEEVPEENLRRLGFLRRLKARRA
jgi:hypothetical protein